MHGAPLFGATLDDSLCEWVKIEEAKIRQWVEGKRILSIEPSSLFYVIWVSTQHYVDFGYQAEVLNDYQPFSDIQFKGAIQTVTSTVLRRIELKP